MPSVLITGANRGLGLEFTRQYAADGWRVFATCRDPDGATDLQNHAKASGQISVHALDVTDRGQVTGLADELSGEAIDVLINNGGTYGDRRGFGELDYDTWARTLDVNAMGPMRMAEAFVEHVARSAQKKIANVTSKMGSMGDNGSGGSYVYRSSKAALNAVSVSMAIDLAGRGIKVAILHPGWVATDMGGASAPLEPDASVSGMREVIAGLSERDSGTFYSFDGSVIPW